MHNDYNEVSNEYIEVYEKYAPPSERSRAIWWYGVRITDVAAVLLEPHLVVTFCGTCCYPGLFIDDIMKSAAAT